MRVLISLVSKAGIMFMLLSGLFSSALAVDPGFAEAMAADARPNADKIRDGARRPYQVMEVLGVESGMTAVDVSAGGGWYTRVLSAAVGPEGMVHAQFGPRALERNNGQAGKDLAASLGNVAASFEELADMDANVADVAITALSLHDQFNFRGEDGAKAFLSGIYHVLKPGGMAAVIDHNGSEGMPNGELHRIPAAEAKRLLESVGFEIVEESDILRTAADDHTLSIRDASLGRNSDRFLFIVRKP